MGVEMSFDINLSGIIE